MPRQPINPTLFVPILAKKSYKNGVYLLTKTPLRRWRAAEKRWRTVLRIKYIVRGGKPALFIKFIIIAIKP
jgi:hypothetical protein